MDLNTPYNNESEEVQMLDCSKVQIYFPTRGDKQTGSFQLKIGEKLRRNRNRPVHLINSV